MHFRKGQRIAFAHVPFPGKIKPENEQNIFALMGKVKGQIL